MSGSATDRPPYQRLPPPMHHEEEAVVEESASASPSSAIFRGRSNGGGINISHSNSHNSPDRWTQVATTEDTHEKRSDNEEEDSEHDNHHTSLVGNSRSWEEDDLAAEDDMIRRYQVITRVPTLPAEFGNSTAGGNNHRRPLRRLLTALDQRRQGARQRRAARLLNPKTARSSDIIQTWFCDATNQGIALAAALTAVWVLVGALVHAKAAYWWTGVVLFVLRVSSRSAYQAWARRQRRSTSSNHDNVELPADSGGNAAPYRDAQETPLTMVEA